MSEDFLNQFLLHHRKKPNKSSDGNFIIANGGLSVRILNLWTLVQSG